MNLLEKLLDQVGAFATCNNIAPNIMIMSTWTYFELRAIIMQATPNAFDGQDNYLKTIFIVGHKLEIIRSNDIPDGEFMLATNFKKQ